MPNFVIRAIRSVVENTEQENVIMFFIPTVPAGQETWQRVQTFIKPCLQVWLAYDNKISNKYLFGIAMSNLLRIEISMNMFFCPLGFLTRQM